MLTRQTSFNNGVFTIALQGPGEYVVVSDNEFWPVRRGNSNATATYYECVRFIAPFSAEASALLCDYPY